MDKLPNFHLCFVCGDQNPAGLAVRFWTDGERVRTTFTAREVHMGYHRMAHGGVLAAALDETMGWAPCLLIGRFCVCVELTVQYLKPVPLGVEMIVEGWATSGKRRIMEAEGEIRDGEETVYARGKGRYFPISSERSNEVLSYLTFDDGCVSPWSISGDVNPESRDSAR